MIARLLLHIAVKPLSDISALLHGADKLIHLLFGIAEDHRRLRVIDVHQAAERLDLVTVGDAVVVLVDALHGQLLPHNADDLRIVHIEPGDLHDFRRHSGGEKYRLTLRGNSGENGVNILAEAHGEHFVGFVEDGDLHAAQLQRAPAHVIHHPAGSADDDLDSFAKLRDLTFYILSSVNGDGMDRADVNGQLADLLASLYRKLAGGTQNQRLHAPFTVGENPLNGGNREGGGLACAGLGLSYHVPAAYEQRYGLCLYRRGFLISYVVDCLHDRRGKPEFVKRYGAHKKTVSPYPADWRVLTVLRIKNRMILIQIYEL